MCELKGCAGIAALEQILLCNDISMEKLLNRPEDIPKLEMFLYNFPKVRWEQCERVEVL